MIGLDRTSEKKRHNVQAISSSATVTDHTSGSKGKRQSRTERSKLVQTTDG